MEEFAQNNHVSIVLPEVGQLLNLLVNLKKPKKVLEIGTGIGYSTIWMARALDENGKITTIELLPKRYEIALSNLKKAGLEDRVKLINGDAREIISEIKIHMILFRQLRVSIKNSLTFHKLSKS